MELKGNKHTSADSVENITLDMFDYLYNFRALRMGRGFNTDILLAALDKSEFKPELSDTVIENIKKRAGEVLREEDLRKIMEENFNYRLTATVNVYEGIEYRFIKI